MLIRTVFQTGATAIKLFSNSYQQKNEVFVPDKPFKPSLILIKKVRAFQTGVRVIKLFSIFKGKIS
jgi:hypothetical protein